MDCEVLLTGSPGSVLISTLVDGNRTPLVVISCAIVELFESPSNVHQIFN